VNAERLLALYERIAEAPDAVARLRRFVLDLAVRGKLVAQDPAEESATRMIRPTLPPDAGPHDLPSSWVWVRIGDQLELLNGMAFKPTDWTASGLRIVRIQNLNNPGAPFNHCRPEFARERSLIDDGAFLISWSGTPGTSFGAFIWDRGPAVLNQHIFRCDFKTEAFTARYLQVAINGRLDEMIAKAHGGVGLQHITKGKLEALLIALPPIAEQHRIVAKVDELMALCDRLEEARAAREAKRDQLAAASLARLNTPDPETFPADARFALDALPALTTRPDQIKHLRQTIRNLAVRGKLVPQDPNDEPVADLLARIEADKAQREGRRSRGRSAAAMAAEEGPYEIPASWAWSRFGDITVCRDGERVPVSKEERSTRAKTYDYYGVSGVIDQIDGYLFDKPLLLIGEDGANLINRSTPIAFMARGRYWVNNHAHVIDAIAEPFLRYIELYINAIDLKPYITGTAQPKMNQAKMNSIPVALPPEPEQKRILAKVNDLMVLCDALEESLAAATNARRRLLEATLAEALSSGDTSPSAVAA
jgi:type I restriction enzyme S subunit